MEGDLNGLISINKDARTRGHTNKLVKRRFRGDTRKYYSFSNRVVSPWNSLLANLVNSQSLQLNLMHLAIVN